MMASLLALLIVLLPLSNIVHTTAFLPQCQLCRISELRVFRLNPYSGISSTGDQASTSSDVEELSKFYGQDPDDSNATSFLLSLTPTGRRELQDLLEQVHSARRSKEYRKSDELTAKVRKLGIRIYNNPPVWTTETKTPPTSYVRRKQSQWTERCKELYGSTGHLFRQVQTGIQSIVCPLTVHEINTLLSLYMQAQMQGRYKKANGILFELNINGVCCDAERYLWRADGKRTWEDTTHLARENHTIAPYAEESNNRHPLAGDGLADRVRVEQLVHQRADAVAQEETHLVRYLTMELWKTYRVAVNDSQRTWSFQNADADAVNLSFILPSTIAPGEIQREQILVPPILFAPRETTRHVCSYRPSFYSLSLEEEQSLTRVEFLIEERARKRQEGKFREADAIRKELWMTFNVGLNDRNRQWSVGGVFDDEESKP